MKTKFLLLVVLCSTLLSVNAQTVKPKFGIGLQTDFLGIALQKNQLLLNTTGVNIVFSPVDRFNVNMAFVSNNLQNEDLKRYDRYNAYSIGVGYFIYENKTSNFSIELALDFENSIEDALKLTNHSEKLGVNFYMFKTFYIGTGFKYFQHKKTDFKNISQNNYNWYWQLGYRIYFQKNKASGKQNL